MILDNARQLHIQLTTKCDYYCEHCNFDCSMKGLDMSNNIFVKALEYIEKFNFNIINISGGEISLHKRLLELVVDLSSVINEKSIIKLSSNGSWVYDRDRERQFIDSCKLLESNPNINLNLLITDDKYHRKFWKKENQIELCKKKIREAVLKCNLFTDYPEKLIPLGRCLDNNCQPQLTNEKISIGHKREVYSKGTDIWDGVTVHPTGDISPCYNAQCVIGNIMVDRVRTIEDNLKIFIINSKCTTFSDCKYCQKINKASLELVK